MTDGSELVMVSRTAGTAPPNVSEAEEAMSAIASAAGQMTADEFFTLPQDGTDRELFRGELKERPMSVRNPSHSRVIIQVGYILKSWSRSRPKPRGQVVGGDAGFLLRRDPATIVGIDVAYVSPEVVAATPPRSRVFMGCPVLAVEVLSPSDESDRVADKVEEYLAVGVPLVWVVDPRLQTVQVHKPGQPPDSYNIRQKIPEEPQLPGLAIEVAELFEE
jgi:Uma2 family endonuclease